MRLALLGHPLGHSVSPPMQEAALAWHGLSGRYERLDVAPDRLGEAVALLRSGALDGANVTIPHKQAVLTWVDALAPSAARAGAANTLVVTPSSEGPPRLVAHNTDTTGFVQAWEASFGTHSLQGRRVLLIGAGGAARAVALGALEAGARKLVVVNRQVARAQALVSELKEAQEAAPAKALTADLAYGALERFAELLEEVDAVVQCTSCGTTGHAYPLAVAWPPSLLPETTARLRVMDLVYNPQPSAFLQGFPGPAHHTVGGLDMLVYQGAAAFRLWTGLPAPLDVMRKAAAGSLARLQP